MLELRACVLPPAKAAAKLPLLGLAFKPPERACSCAEIRSIWTDLNERLWLNKLAKVESNISSANSESSFFLNSAKDNNESFQEKKRK